MHPDGVTIGIAGAGAATGSAGNICVYMLNTVTPRWAEPRGGGERDAAQEAAPARRLRPAGVQSRSLLASIAQHSVW